MSKTCVRVHVRQDATSQRKLNFLYLRTKRTISPFFKRRSLFNTEFHLDYHGVNVSSNAINLDFLSFHKNGSHTGFSCLKDPGFIRMISCKAMMRKNILSFFRSRYNLFFVYSSVDTKFVLYPSIGDNLFLLLNLLFQC